MGDLYSNKWTLSISSSDGAYTREFNLWTDNLSKRSPDEIAAGFKLLETRVKSNYENGKENWPPSYAEFAALCKPYKYRATTPVPEASRIELTEEQVAANKEKVSDEINKLKGMFE